MQSTGGKALGKMEQEPVQAPTLPRGQSCWTLGLADTCELQPKRLQRTYHTTIACRSMMEVKIKKHYHLPMSLLPCHAQRPDWLQARACDVPDHKNVPDYNCPEARIAGGWGLWSTSLPKCPEARLAGGWGPSYNITMPSIDPGALVSPQNLKPAALRAAVGRKEGSSLEELV